MAACELLAELIVSVHVSSVKFKRDRKGNKKWSSGGGGCIGVNGSTKRKKVRGLVLLMKWDTLDLEKDTGK